MQSSLPWLIGMVLRLVPDEELIGKAKEVLAKSRNAQLEHDLIFTLLKMNPPDEKLRKDAQRWIRKHGQQLPAKELKSLLFAPHYFL
jgi:hypothetical protein